MRSNAWLPKRTEKEFKFKQISRPRFRYCFKLNEYFVAPIKKINKLRN